MEREAGGGIGMGNTCKSMADSCQCMAKTLQYCKVISLQLIKINLKKIKKNFFSKLLCRRDLEWQKFLFQDKAMLGDFI